MITLPSGAGRPKGCENPKHETRITKPYTVEKDGRYKFYDGLETEQQMRKRLLE